MGNRLWKRRHAAAPMTRSGAVSVRRLNGSSTVVPPTDTRRLCSGAMSSRPYAQFASLPGTFRSRMSHWPPHTPGSYSGFTRSGVPRTVSTRARRLRAAQDLRDSRIVRVDVVTGDRQRAGRGAGRGPGNRRSRCAAG